MFSVIGKLVKEHNERDAALEVDSQELIDLACVGVSVISCSSLHRCSVLSLSGKP